MQITYEAQGEIKSDQEKRTYKSLDAWRIICLPTGVEPVNAILSTSG